MNIFWLQLFASFFFQETVTTTSVILQAEQNGMSAISLLGIWLIMTSIGIILGYTIGKAVRSKLTKTKKGARIIEHAEQIERQIGKNGEYFAIIFITLINFVYLNAFFCSWLKIDFKKMFALMLVGNILNFYIVYEITKTSRSLFSNIYSTFLIVFGVTLLVTFVAKKLLARK